MLRFPWLGLLSHCWERLCISRATGETTQSAFFPQKIVLFAGFEKPYQYEVVGNVTGKGTGWTILLTQGSLGQFLNCPYPIAQRFMDQDRESSVSTL